MENILFPNMEIACPVVVHFPLVLGISVWNSVKCIFQMLIFKSNWVLPLGKMMTQFFSSFSAHFFSHLTRLSLEIPRLTFFSSYFIVFSEVHQWQNHFDTFLRFIKMFSVDLCVLSDAPGSQYFLFWSAVIQIHVLISSKKVCCQLILAILLPFFIRNPS